MIGDIVTIIRDNWLLLLVGQYPNGPLGGVAATLILSVLSIVLAFPVGDADRARPPVEVAASCSGPRRSSSTSLAACRSSC